MKIKPLIYKYWRNKKEERKKESDDDNSSNIERESRKNNAS